jgi:hypothetical protein
MQMEMFMKDSGRMTKLTEKEFINILMEQNIMECGKKTSKTGME